MAVVMDTMVILMATTMVTGIVIIVVQGVALAINADNREDMETRQMAIFQQPTSKSAAYFDSSSLNFAVRAGKTSL